MALVDVIVPVFNTQVEYVTEAMKSLREQTFADWHAWIVDDGSDPDYGKRLQELLTALQDNRVTYLFTPHKGASGSRNVAMERGTAPYIGFLDSDDYWLPHHLERQIGLLEGDPAMTLVHGYFEVIDSNGQEVVPAPPFDGLNELDNTQSFVKMLKENFVGASTVVVRRSMIEKVSGFDATFPSLADKEMWLRMLNENAQFHYVPESSVLYRVHPGNISKNTDLLLATRRRIIDKAAALVATNARYANIDWPSIKKEMVRHMYREAAEVHFAQGRYSKAIKYGAPWFSGLSQRSCMIVLRSFSGLLLGYLTATVHDLSAFVASIGADR